MKNEIIINSNFALNMAANNKKHDAFLSSMTFASGDISCECDECGLSDDVPSAI